MDTMISGMIDLLVKTNVSKVTRLFGVMGMLCFLKVRSFQMSMERTTFSVLGKKSPCR